MDTAKAKDAKLEGRVDTEDDSPGTSSEDSYDWKVRRTTSKVIDSVKKRVAMQKSPPLEHNGNGGAEEISTTHPVAPEKSLSLDEKLEELVPEKKTLSLEAQKVLSLDRNRSRVFKIPPTYNALECMFGPSMSNTASSLYSNNSLYSSFRSNDSGLPSVTSRNLSDSAKSSPGFSISLESDAFEPAANDDPKAEVKPKDSEGSRKKSHSHESPSRPPYFKSISSPSKIMNFVQHKVSSGSRSSEESDDNKSDVSGKQGKQTRRKFKEAATNHSFKTISKLPMAALHLSTDDTEEEDEKARKEMQEIEEALKSPTIREKPFRKRSGAVRLSVEERRRSSSAPNSPSFSVKSPEAEQLNCTSD